MSSLTYWKRRNKQIAARQKILDAAIEETQKEIAQQYRLTANKLIQRALELQNEILAEGKDNVLHSHLYQYEKYYKELAQIEKELQKLGYKEIKLLDKSLTKTYEEVSKIVSSDLKLSYKFNADAVKNVVYSYWVNDGLKFDERIWKNKKLLLVKLEEGLSDILGTGKSPDILKKELMKVFSTNYSNADRLVRTELAHIENQAALDRYKDAGIKYVRWLTAEDAITKYNKMRPASKAKSSVCQICIDLGSANPTGYGEGIYEISAAPLNPQHPNCRCTYLGLIDYEINKLKKGIL